jgi:hypothetical protein
VTLMASLTSPLRKAWTEADHPRAEDGTFGAGAALAEARVKPRLNADQIADQHQSKARELLSKFAGPARYIRAKTDQLRARLTERYGVKGATAIMAAGQVITWSITVGAPLATGLPIIVPPGGGLATSLALAGMVEVYRKMRGTKTKSADNLTEEEIQAAAVEVVNELLAGIHAQLQGDDMDIAEPLHKRLTSIRKAKDASGHEHDKLGQFAATGGGASGSSDAHKEASAKLNAGAAKPSEKLAAKRAELRSAMDAYKSERKVAFGELKGKAEAASDKANEHVESMRKATDNLAWDTDNEDEQHFAALEEARMDYDESATASERFEQLKVIEATAKEALAVDQPVAREPSAEDKAKATKLREQAMDAERQRNALFDQYAALEKEGDKAKLDTFVAEKQPQLEALATASQKARDQADEIDHPQSGISAEDKATNKQHLQAVLASVKEAKAALREYVAHRKEMRAIRDQS